MRYVVAWNRARFLADGQRVVVSKGHDVPDGVEEHVLHELVLVGAIVAAGPPATSPEAAALVDPVDPGEVERPAATAKVDVWRGYAIGLGIDAAKLKKAEVIAAVDEFEAAGSAVTPETPDPVEVVVDNGGEVGSAGDPDEPTIS